MGVITRFSWYHPTNSIVYLVNFLISMSDFSSPTNPFSKYQVDEIFRKSFICLSVQTIPSILSMEFEPELYLRFCFSISLDLISAYDLYLAYFFYLYSFFSWANSVYFHIQDLHIQHISLSRVNFLLFTFLIKKKGDKL